MRTIIYTNQVKKDYKLVKKQNKDLAKLKLVISKLAAGETLDEKFKDHPLQTIMPVRMIATSIQIGC
jgi:addiction module RelE/StbE family toxin